MRGAADYLAVTPRKAPSEDQLREAFTEVGDALQRAVVLSSDRVQSVFEDAVLRGRMTRRDAEELAASIMALGRDQAQELRGEVDALARALPAIPAKVADAVDPRVKRRRKKLRDEEQEESRREAARFVSAEAFADKPKTAKATPAKATPATPAANATPAGKAKPAAKRKAPIKAPAATAPGKAPADPSSLTVKELVALVPTLAPSELTVLRTREAAGKGRATVLKAIDQKAKA